MREEQSNQPWAMAALRWLLALGMALTILAAVTTSASAKPPGVICSGQGTAKMLVPVGKTVGIKLFARGVMVVGLTDVATEEGTQSPAKACGLKTGDIITEINGQSVNSIEEVQEVLRDSGGALAIRATRNGKELCAATQAAASMEDGSYKLGAWIRDSMAGIGTVTYYDPETGQFAALGHGINDVDTGLLMPLQTGAIMPSRVTGLLQGEKGSPGALHGSFDLTTDLGRLTANTNCGIFGQMESGCFAGQAMEVASRSEVKTGEATILANVEGETVEEYTIEILRIYPDSGEHTQSMMIRVTDQRLLDKTGGILQGMSGSPICQNGKIVGAVTHVLVNDPTRGYGIFIENMLEAAG